MKKINKDMFADIDQRIFEAKITYEDSKEELAALKREKAVMKDALRRQLPDMLRHNAVEKFRKLYIEPLKGYEDTFWKGGNAKDFRGKPIVSYVHLKTMVDYDRLMRRYETAIKDFENAAVYESLLSYTEERWFDRLLTYAGICTINAYHERNPLFECTEISFSEGYDGRRNFSIRTNGFLLNQSDFENNYEKISKEEFISCFGKMKMDLSNYENDI